MNYRKDFEKCLAYIESNLTNELSPVILSRYIGYSLFHFCRLFQIYKGVTPMAYIRKRKLEKSLIDIMNNHKIIDVALKYGFQTPSGFSKAFRKVYGVSPKKYALQMKEYDHKVPLSDLAIFIKQPILKEISSFRIAGYGIETDIAGYDYSNELIAFWNDFEAYSYEEKMYELINPRKHGEIGIAIPNSLEESKMLYLCGVIADQNHVIPNDMILFDIPCGLYAVFTTPPIDMRKHDDNLAKMVKNTWQHIFSNWLPKSEYVYDESRYDFEFYDERCHYLENSTMDIYIPIKIAT